LVSESVDDDRVVLDVVRQIEHQARAQRGIADVVEMIRADTGDVVLITLAELLVDAQAHARPVAQRRVDDRLRTPQVIIAPGLLGVAFEGIGRLAWHQQHRTAGRVAAEQRALRAFEHLHVLQVEERARTGAVAGLHRAAAARCDDVGEIDRH
jgi:hypothetical protein